MDQSKKTMRHFYCRDSLWESFEDLAGEFDCSIDYLVNEAMRYYSLSKSAKGAAGKATVPKPSSASTPAVTGGTLYLHYDGNRYEINKEQFIIGRGSKSSDLPIKDGNISRKHCAVIKKNDTYYIKDLGSTNGIDFKGMRIDNKRIDEGDVFHLCDYELRFTYQAD